MNRQEFTLNESFPLSTQTMAFMQDMITATTQLSRIGGDNYILSGCTKTGNTIAPGIIVVKGEPIPFEGGVESPNITIVETIEDITANNVSFNRARVKRSARFATGTSTNYLTWANFLPLSTNQQLNESKATIQYVNDEIAKITAGSIPSGIIAMWSGAIAEIPKGWALCNGDPANKTPDLRSKFIVGYNRDDADYNTIGAQGGANAVALTSLQMPKHQHLNGMVDDDTRTFVNGCTKATYQGVTIKGEGEHADRYQGYTSFTGGEVIHKENECNAHENRPPYYVLAYIMKL